MPIRARVSCIAIFLFLASCFTPSQAQHPGNTNPIYEQLRGLLPGDEVISVNNLDLHRDAATLTFRSGEFAFYREVNGKVTGAVFKGDGHLHVTPPTAEERHNLAIVNKTEEFDEDFSEAVLRFTDATAAELRRASTGKGAPDSEFSKAAQEFHNFERLKLKDNLDLRLLEDVLSPVPGNYFLAVLHGKKYPHLLFSLDPHGVPDVSPEEVALLNWSDWGETYPLAFYRAAEYANSTANGSERNAAYRITNENLDVSIEKSGLLTSLATVEIRADQDGTVVIPLDLYPTLRVTRVETGKGDPLDFVQEKKDEDADFGVLLAKPLSKGESTTIRISYSGKDVVQNEGGANYYPIARQSWYPNSSQGLGDYATYHMLFHVPKGLQLIATGTKVNENTDGKITTSEWKTDVPLPVVGFNLGRFTMKEATVENKLANNLTIDAYANTTPPDELSNLADLNLGNFSAPSMLPTQLSQGEVAARIYSSYFGTLPFAKVAITQQFACNYGQSWPMLVYLPICGFLDTTQQNSLGLRPEDMYWKVVTPHEVAHQWWGQTVGFRSYRDQWMSEGFANTSASIFLQLTRPKPDDFREFWKQQRKLITEKNAMGFRPIDVGPVTMGFRLSSQKTGWDIYQNLVYPKGAYILHMIRMMMWTPQEGEERFKATMHDFLDTYRMQAATTEEFKAMVEKHMSTQMDLDHNHRMDWFFNQYVYGTELPTYHFEGQATPNDKGTSIHFKLTQSGVSPGFKNLVPIYLEFADGKVIHLGGIPIIGPTTMEQTAQLPKMPGPIKRLMINYYYDVLCIEN